jgi:hypothetical protein
VIGVRVRALAVMAAVVAMVLVAGCGSSPKQTHQVPPPTETGSDVTIPSTTMYP